MRIAKVIGIAYVVITQCILIIVLIWAYVSARSKDVDEALAILGQYALQKKSGSYVDGLDDSIVRRFGGMEACGRMDTNGTYYVMGSYKKRNGIINIYYTLDKEGHASIHSACLASGGAGRNNLSWLFVDQKKLNTHIELMIRGEK